MEQKIYIELKFKATYLVTLLCFDCRREEIINVEMVLSKRTIIQKN